MSEENEGIEAMDEMERRLELMSLGETAYLILVGAQAAGADTNEDSMIIITSFFMSKLLTDEPPQEDDSDDATD